MEWTRRVAVATRHGGVRWPYLAVFAVIAFSAISACTTSAEGEHQLQTNLADLAKWSAEGGSALLVLLLPSIILTLLLNLPGL